MSASSTNTGITITENGVTIPDVAVIRNEISVDYKAIWGQDFDTASYTPQGQMIDTETAIVDDKNAQLQYVLNQFDPEKNEGIWQEGIGKIYFITRKSATKTTVVCQVVGIVGTVIPAGSLVQDDTNVLYATTADFTITTPSPMDLVFQCQTPGPVLCPAGSINRIYSQILGWDTVSNAAAGITGTNEETRMGFEKRRYDSVSKNAHGNVDAVRGAVANLDNVISVKIAHNRTGIPRTEDPITHEPWGVTVNEHSMFISVVGGTDLDVALAIWERIDGGCGQDGNTNVILYIPSPAGLDMLQEAITFNRPQTVEGFVQVTIKDYTNTPGNIDDLIKQAVVDAWNGVGDALRVEIADTVYGLRFACPLNSLGGFQLVSIFVSRDTATNFGESFSTTYDEFATISLQNVTVIHE